jgi:glycosyltransferase involved in cell wall biosynthesis
MTAAALESIVPEAPRLGLTFPADPYASTSWSGTPAGLIAGLLACGVTVSGIGLHLPLVLHKTVLGTSALVRLRPWSRGSPNVLHEALTRARVAPSQGRLETFLARRRLRGPRRFDAIVQLGTGYSLPPAATVVTLEDMTVPLARQLGFEGYRDLSPRALAARRAAQARAYANAVACCATSAWAAESIIADYDIPRDRVHVVGVGANHLPRVVERDWSRPRFLFIGSDWHVKNGDAVVRAFTVLRETWPDAHLDVVGHHPRLDVPGVSTHGWMHPDRAADRGRMEGLFQKATCFVMPSHCEAMGIVYAEASYAGIASIGTRDGGCSQIIGHTGRVVDPDDDVELLDAMRELAKPGRARELGALAHDRSRLFTWQAVAERLLRALRLPGMNVEDLAEFLEPVSLAAR